tara:strand:+ start:3346 stop:4275 length:930 start_codon:yes stop_codon:yes gene_type:complete
MKEVYFIIICIIILWITIDYIKEPFRNYSNKGVLVIDKTKSKYQTIELVKDKYLDKYCLFLNGEIQNHSDEAYRSHDAMVNVSIKLSNKPIIEDILILGGGDGYPAMYALQHPNVKVTNVELDDVLIKFIKTNPIMRKLTKNSFNDPNLELYAMDAYEFINKNSRIYDIIIHDIEMETKQPSEITKIKNNDYNIFNNILDYNGVMNYTDYNDDIKLNKIAVFIDQIKNNSKYNIIVFYSDYDMQFLKSFFLLDTLRFKRDYPDGEIGIMMFDEYNACGKLSYGEEFFIYISKRKFRRGDPDIKFHKMKY